MNLEEMAWGDSIGNSDAPRTRMSIFSVEVVLSDLSICDSVTIHAF